MMSSLLPLFTFLAVVMGVTAVASLFADMFQRDRNRVKDRLDVEFRDKQREKVKRSLLFKEVESIQGGAAEDGKSRRTTWREWFQTMVDQSGLQVTLKRLLTYCGGLGAVLALTGWIIAS